MSNGLADRAAAHTWYHTIDLADGVATPGFVDLRGLPGKLPLPESLAGKRCLDVGTQNGFWAFELERRGASAVVGIDVDDAAEFDWPPSMALRDPSLSHLPPDDRKKAAAAFEFARSELGSSAERRALSIYDASPDKLGGSFDLVFIGSLLLHLRDPVLALTRAREVLGEGGEAVVFEAIDLRSSVGVRRRPVAKLDGTRNWWWWPNPAALSRMAESAGFDVVDRTGILWVPRGPAFHRVTPRGVLTGGLRQAVTLVKGFAHVGLRLRPL